MQKDAASAGVGAGEYLLRATAGSSNAYGKIAVSGSKVPLKDLAPLLGAQITYDSVTGLTLYQAGNKTVSYTHLAAAALRCAGLVIYSICEMTARISCSIIKK